MAAEALHVGRPRKHGARQFWQMRLIKPIKVPVGALQEFSKERVLVVLIEGNCDASALLVRQVEVRRWRIGARI